ncbi:hypothetical protein [Streptomyces sp. KLOTTS4A1]|uniref:hypothetical protein n=1 Tax=Streptomyces sp. KLOTTS4A1 TaxID=3390996 RepID=UPI0039F61FF2
MTDLGMPYVPEQKRRDIGGGVGYAFNGQHFDAPANHSIEEIADTLTAPLSTIVEPHKCAGLSWHPYDQLPDNTVPYNALGIAHYLKGEPFSVHGW